VWTPLLAYLGIPYRRPYETRHTAATLWLGAGENPTWIAKQMGHSNTEMLFTVYTRYVPNLTRQDGSAMERLIANGIRLDLPKQGFKINPVADDLSHWDALLVGNASAARV
jgi:integrase